MAVVNGDGTIGFGLTVVTAPGAAPLHLDVSLNPSSLAGTWRDDAGNSGTLIFNPSAPSGPTRPVPPRIADGAVTTAKIAPGAVESSRVLDGSTTGFQNTVVGAFAHALNATGNNNTAIGTSALASSTGNSNIALGNTAGSNVAGGSDNIYLRHPGVAGESKVMRLGEPTFQTRTFIAGIFNVQTGINDAVPVLIASDGQLGTVSSSRRYKEDIAAMATASSAIMRLRPVTFRYRQPFGDASKPLQHGLIAEEVAEVMPSLAVFNEEGQPEAVKYHELPVLLLNEVQRLEREVTALKKQMADLLSRMERR